MTILYRHKKPVHLFEHKYAKFCDHLFKQLRPHTCCDSSQDQFSQVVPYLPARGNNCRSFTITCIDCRMRRVRRSEKKA